MKNPKIDIYKTLIINRFVVLALMAAFTLAALFFSISIKNLYKEMLNTVLVIDSKGAVIPMRFLDRDEVIHIEIKDHLNRFHEYFYGYDALNVDKRLERSLWYGDNSVEQLFIKRNNDGWYNKVKLYGIKQEIEINEIEVTGDSEPFSFRVVATLSIFQDEQVTRYRFETVGNLIYVSPNYPLNPHGLLITNFSEVNRIQIE